MTYEYFHNKRTKVEDPPQSSEINPHCHVMNMGFCTGTYLMRAITLVIIESDLGQDSYLSELQTVHL